MAVAACPKPETLAAFARGDLGAEELASVADHLGTCEACGKVLQFVPEDSLAGLARAAAASPNTLSLATVHSGSVPNPLAPGALKGAAAAFANHPRYRILGELGAGGMGTVYKAHDELMDRVVAVKVVSPHLTAKAGALARFHKEVRAAAKLEHVNIVRAYDAGEAGGSQFLVMEFVEGISLDKLVAKKGPLSVQMACAFVRQAALGLQHAAEKGMTHRDIKPQNLMVNKKGQVRILDFGLARFASTEEEPAPRPTARLPFGAGKPVVNAGVTNPNLLMGTPDYLSPEQAKNSHDVDPRSDIYSLGCTLYFLLTGKPPFGHATTLIDKLIAHTEEAPPPIREARFEVTEGLAEVLARMMAKKPDDRYQTAREAADALHAFTRTNSQEPVFEVVEAAVVTPAPVAAPSAQQPRPELAFDTEPLPAAPTLGDTPRPKKPRKAKKRQSWWQRHAWSLLGAAALFIAAAVALAVLSKKPASTQKEAPANDPPAAAKNNSPPPQAKGEKAGGEKPNPWTSPTEVTPTRKPKVLYVVPSSGVWLHDYTEVRNRLESNGVTVVTASTDGGIAKAHPDLPGPAVTIDKPLTANMNFSDYSAIVFAGRDVDEYMFGRGSAAARKAVKEMQDAGKPVAAICTGVGALAAHGALKGKKVAHCRPLVEKYPDFATKAGLAWDSPGLTVDRSDGNKVVITASGGRESVQFADAILTAIGVSPK